MKKSLKKYISVVLATIMTATSVAFVNTTSVFADTSESTTATVVETGDCGDNVKYSLDSDGVLTISGSGDMKNFNHNTASYTSPFRNNSSIKKVIIENGVTSVGKESFEYCSGITSVEIPNSVTDIGESAFSMCTGITSIAIPDSVTSIGKSAFYQNSITSVEIPDGVTILEESVFMNCSKLKSVKMPKNLEYIMDYVFSGCSSLEDIEIPSSVGHIGDYSFSSCKSLTSITIPDGITILSTGIFQNCSNLTSVTIPSSVTYICNFTFQNCTSLAEITIPDTITTFAVGVFRGCTALKSITLPESVAYIGNDDFRDCTALESITILNIEANIGTDVFKNCNALKTVKCLQDSTAYKYTYPSNPEKVIIDEDTTESTTESSTETTTETTTESITETTTILEKCGDNITYSLDSDGVLTLSGSGNMYDYDNDDSKRPPFFAYKDNITKVVIEDGITNIGEYMFAYCNKITSVTMPHSVKTIKQNAFLYSTKLEEIAIPYGVQTIEDSAFEECWNLKSIEIPSSVTSMGSLFNESWITTVYCVKNSYADKDGTATDKYTNYPSTASMNYTRLGQCGDNVYYRIDSDGVLTISGTGDMYDYQMYVTQSPFYENTAIKKIVIESGVTNIGADVFASCTSVTDIEIPSSVNSIEEFAISGCWALKNITIPSTVRAMGKYIFSGCNGLNIYCVQNSIADKYKYYPNGTVKIYLEPTTEITTETTTITGSCGDNATYSLDSDGVLTISGSGKTYDYEYMDLDKNYSPFRSNKFIHKIIIKNGITSIGAGLFQYCKNVYSIEIPNSVKSIGQFSFGGCSCLDSMTIPNSVETIDDYIFSGCGVLKVYCVQNSTADSYGQYPSGSEKIYISNVTGFESMDNGLVSDIDTDSPFADTVAGLDSTDKVFTLIGIITGNHTDTTFLNKISEVGFDIVNADDAEKIDISAKSIRPEDLKDKDSSLNIINIKATEIYKNIYNTEHYDASKDSQKGYTGETKTTDDDNTSYFAELVAVCKGNRYYVYPYTKYTGSEYKVYETTVSGYELNNN